MNNNLNILYGSRVNQASQQDQNQLQTQKKESDLLKIVFIVLIVLLCSTLGFMIYQVYLLNQAKNTPPAPIISQPIPSIVPSEPIACTMDVKLCPDGTSVGRTPPTCEFKPCPEVSPKAEDTITPTL